MPHEAGVLVVEDNAVLALHLCEALEEAGLRVIDPCLTYAEAVDAIAQETPRYVATNIDLGRGDPRPGFEGERVLAILTNAGCRCVVYSGHVGRFATLGSYSPRSR